MSEPTNVTPLIALEARIKGMDSDADELAWNLLLDDIARVSYPAKRADLFQLAAREILDRARGPIQ